MDINSIIITPSHWSKKGFIRSGFRDEAIKVIGHGIDPSTFFAVDADLRGLYRELLGINSDDFVLLTVSALTDNKGIDLLLRAYLTLKQTHPRLKLVVKKPGNLYRITVQDCLSRLAHLPELEGQRESYLNDIIEVSDNLDLDGMRALYNACDAYISPYKGEGFNLPPLEASACGLPILVTRGGPTDDYFDARMGLQIEGKLIDMTDHMYLEPDFDSLIDGLEKLIESRGQWDGVAASFHTQQNFNWSKITDQLVETMGLK